MAATLKQLEQKAAGVIAVALPLSLVIFTYERELTPLYASGPTHFLLDKFVLGAAFLSVVRPFRIPLKWNLLATALALTLAPNATYWVAVWTARKRQPVIGPAITHASVLGPLTFLLTTFVAEMEDPGVTEEAQMATPAIPPIVIRLLRGVITFLVSFLLFQRVWYPSSILYNISDSQIYLGLAGVFYGLWIGSLSLKQTVQSDPKSTSKSKTTPKKKKTKDSPLDSATSSLADVQIKGAILVGFAVVWWTIYPFFANPIVPHPLRDVYTHPTYPLQILSAEQSITGLVTVAQWLPPSGYKGEPDEEMHSARYIRASHSILGGVWTHQKVATLDGKAPLQDYYGTPLGDSIYATFVLQEAVRMVNSTEIGKENKWKNALVIGLGTGISATSFMRHGISTTVVEIDPAVYRAARTYFGLPDPGAGQVFLEDARAWVANKRASSKALQNEELLYDIVVHDCFSGGGVPEHIFTMEFWNDLKFVMAPGAILAVNFAGIVNSEATRLVISTLDKSFGQCRAFHDLFENLPKDKLDTEFLNMVIFCTQSSDPLAFRETKQSDWLGSYLRRHVLQTLESREVDLASVREVRGDEQYILTDKHNPLGALQEKQGAHHWTVMREVLPDVHWETY